MAKTQFGQDAAQQNAIAQRQRADKNKWEEMLALLQFAHKGDPQTMLGFGLGRLLRDGFNTWMKNYKDRGAAKERKAYGDYENLVKLGGYDGSFKDYYNNVWEPRYQENKRMMQDDARAQAEMGNQIASDGRPINIATKPTFTGNGGEKGDTEMNGADNAYVANPGASESSEKSALSKYYAENMYPDYMASSRPVELPDIFDGRRFKYQGLDGITRYTERPALSLRG